MIIKTLFDLKTELLIRGHDASDFGRFEVVSKPQIRFKGKAQADRESAAYFCM
jgi:hypothetical protein